MNVLPEKQKTDCVWQSYDCTPQSQEWTFFSTVSLCGGKRLIVREINTLHNVSDKLLLILCIISGMQTTSKKKERKKKINKKNKKIKKNKKK